MADAHGSGRKAVSDWRGCSAMPWPGTPQELAARVRTEYERHGNLTRDANVKAN